MFSTTATALTGLVAVALVHALPAPNAAAETAPSAPSGVNGNDNPFTYPLSNGFPAANISDATISDIEDQALGTLPNGPPPPSLAQDDITSLELIAFNEIFEVAFFTELLYNITTEVEGYEVMDNADYAQLVATITAVQAQEQLHAINANGALAHFNVTPIGPCQYDIPVTNLTQALSLAKLFTDVVLGTLPNIQSHLAQNQDVGLIAAIGSVIGQEGEQNGYYRSALGLVPSALPFLTAGARAFAFSALNQVFVVPGSCPNVAQINLPIFAPLSVEPAEPSPETQTLTFTIGGAANGSLDGLSLAYINQQNTPVVVNITSNGGASFTAEFPYEQYLMNGLTIGALVNSTGPFADAEAVANATVAGPALIEIN